MYSSLLEVTVSFGSRSDTSKQKRIKDSTQNDLLHFHDYCTLIGNWPWDINPLWLIFRWISCKIWFAQKLRRNHKYHLLKSSSGTKPSSKSTSVHKNPANNISHVPKLNSKVKSNKHQPKKSSAYFSTTLQSLDLQLLETQGTDISCDSQVTVYCKHSTMKTTEAKIPTPRNFLISADFSDIWEQKLYPVSA